MRLATNATRLKKDMYDPLVVLLGGVLHKILYDPLVGPSMMTL